MKRFVALVLLLSGCSSAPVDYPIAFITPSTVNGRLP